MLAAFGWLTAGEATPESEQLEMPADRIKAALRTVASPVAVLAVWVGTLWTGWRPAGPTFPATRPGINASLP